MSMLTGQADELRKAALIQEEHTRYDMTLLLTNATDTIRSLRYRVRELRAENAKLRNQIDAAHMSRLLTENENESLRELVRLMWKPFCWAQSGHDACLTDEQDRAIRDMVRELEVEVD